MGLAAILGRLMVLMVGIGILLLHPNIVAITANLLGVVDIMGLNIFVASIGLMIVLMSLVTWKGPW